MSMFHELMMRKKEQIMYATIKGSLTENDGVFSGFSASSYLDLQQPIVYNNNFEIFFKITTGTIGTNQAIFDWSDSNIGLTLIIYPSLGKLFMSAGNGQSWIIDKLGTTTLSPNTTYYIKFSYKNNVYKLELSTDNTNWNTEILVESSSLIKSTSANKSIGFSKRFNSRIFTGSIDLPNSYIKLGSTKYNLQAVVGYTIFGSPTITDGVVSGFATSDYVRTSQDWDTFADAETWKIHTRITTGESYSTTRATGIISGQGFQTGFGISNNGYLQAIIYLSNNSSFSLTTSFVIESNTSYDIELEKTQSQYIFRVKKTNTVTWEEKTNNSTLLVRNNAYNPNYLYFGNVNYFSVVFTGSIDMNETIIFVNNKLYFNGQQA